MADMDDAGTGVDGPAWQAVFLALRIKLILVTIGEPARGYGRRAAKERELVRTLRSVAHSLDDIAALIQAVSPQGADWPGRDSTMSHQLEEMKTMIDNLVGRLSRRTAPGLTATLDPAPESPAA
jgi:hypothetical protein